MEAIASDPVPLIDDLGQEETVRALVDRFITRSDMQPVENSGIGGDA
ncbi:truncated hemoglobin YjbI [Rhizobium wenxiniae]|uniref:Truncated hemoglobin YjbI n=1 Tax=Rhizobium wenxiniae TaxID=1737357 RepID=A0A7W9Y7N3_9HYPH|nr:truncated hemoglobin YjbI [Rhizobium wenxiniae]